jgi:phosphatidylserine/phosphatidylglycerophosphate/cardiolipin synthase-like enzyme
MNKLRNNKSTLSDAALFRASGAPLVSGNFVRILKDGKENYPEWESAIESAKHYIHLEMYIIHNDATGGHFRDLLAKKAAEGVKVRVLYDWFGSRSIIGRKMWKPLIEAGGEIRVANPPKMSGLFGWLRRDHRKLLAVDGNVAYVSGLCIGDAWVGEPQNGIEAWRDTGLMIKGPAVADAEKAFEEAWLLSGGAIPKSEFSQRVVIGKEGDVDVRVVAASPETAGLYRLDLLVASAAQEYLWLTDAYFLGTNAYIAALRSAALDGVDVRLLVPQGSDIQWIANMSRTTYRTLLEAGVKVYEWNGQMMHAKTAVCDDRWARVGSTNLNLSSWLGNWELDVVIEDEKTASDIADMYLEDLKNSTEIVITESNKVRPVKRRRRGRRGAGLSGYRTQSVITRAVTAGSVLNAAVTGKRKLSRAESAPLFTIGLILCAVAAAIIFLPNAFAYACAGLLIIVGVFLLGRAAKLKLMPPDADKSA